MSIYILAALTVETQNGKILTRARPNPRTATLLIWGQGPDHCRNRVVGEMSRSSYFCPAILIVAPHLRMTDTEFVHTYVFPGWVRIKSPLDISIWVRLLLTSMEHVVYLRRGESDKRYVHSGWLHCIAAKVAQKSTMKITRSHSFRSFRGLWSSHIEKELQPLDCLQWNMCSTGDMRYETNWHRVHSFAKLAICVHPKLKVC